MYAIFVWYLYIITLWLIRFWAEKIYIFDVINVTLILSEGCETWKAGCNSI